jgi:hypothetical protein
VTCVTWNCDAPAIAPLTVRRPCGHPVSFNSSGDRLSVVDGTPIQRVQRQWSCREHVLARAGKPAPGPSTCPACGVREPVTVDQLTHAPDPEERLLTLCARDAGHPSFDRGNFTISYDAAAYPITCPSCLEWIHA